MNEEVLALAVRAKDEATDTLSRISKELRHLGDASTTAGRSAGVLDGVLGGLGAGVGIAGVMGLQSAVGTLTGVMGGAVRSAMDEQAGMARLSIAVRDAIPGWDGHTKAIERAIQARIGLGFNDDALRASFTGLVARTKDINEALRLQAVAMDIARFRGVDLETASIAVGKAFQGSAVALQRMGIAVTAGASGQEALAQAIAATRGQAEGYAEVASGKLEGAQGRLNQAMQNFGAVVLPVVADSASNLTTVIEGLTGAMNSVGGATGGANAIGTAWDLTLSNLTFGASKAFASSMGLAKANLATEQAVETAREATEAYDAKLDESRIALELTISANVSAAAAARAYAAAQVSATLSLEDRTEAEIRLDNAIRQITTTAAGVNVITTRFGNITTTATTAVHRAYDPIKALTNVLGPGGYAGAVDAAAAASARLSGHGGFGAVSAAAEKLKRAIHEQLGDAYTAFRTKALDALAAVHEKKLQAIEDDRKLRNAALDAAAAEAQGKVDAAQAAFDTARAARELARLQADVATAAQSGDTAEMQRAQQALADFTETQRIKTLQADADAVKAKADADKKRVDEQAVTAKKAEDDRYGLQKTALDAQLALLRKKLDDGSKLWTVHMRTIVGILEKANPEVAKQGDLLGAIFGSKVKAALEKSIVDIAKLIAKLLNIPMPSAVELAELVGSLEGPPAKASGGDVGAGTAYIVGERGPELFIPRVSGTVIPNGVAIGSSGGGNLNLNVTVSGPAIFDPQGIAAQQLATALLPSLRRALAQQGTSL